MTQITITRPQVRLIDHIEITRLLREGGVAVAIGTVTMGLEAQADIQYLGSLNEDGSMSELPAEAAPIVQQYLDTLPPVLSQTELQQQLNAATSLDEVKAVVQSMLVNPV